MDKQKLIYGVITVIVVSVAIVVTQSGASSLEYQVVSEGKTGDEQNSSASQEVLSESIYVQVSGEAVGEPGLYQLPSGSRINDLVEAAKVVDYNPDCINLAQKLVDEQNIEIPSSGQPCPQASPISASGVVNINTASALELQTLSGIGEAKATAIVEYREQNGTFETLDELLNVDGISESLLQSIAADISLS